MVRTGAVPHPANWDVCGYRELQHPPKRYRIIDRSALASLLGIDDQSNLQLRHADWVDEALKAEAAKRDDSWTESLAVGSPAFVDRFQLESGLLIMYQAQQP